jgi:hypothetical protein
MTRVFVTADGAEGYVVMPRFAAGTVIDFINAPTTTRDAVCNGEWIRAFVREALRGVARLHDVGVIHGGLHPSNILLDATHMPVIANFEGAVPAFDVPAMAKTTTTTTAVVAVEGGTTGFIAPEVAADPSNAASVKADVYSLGRTVERVLAAIRDRFGAAAAPPSAALLSKMLARMTADDPSQRPTAAQAIADPFLATELQGAQRLAARLRPPWYWASDDATTDRFAKVDVTAAMRVDMQTLMDRTCVSATLGCARDQKEQGAYVGLDVRRVFRIENTALWHAFCQRRHRVGAKRWGEPPLPAKGVATMDACAWLHEMSVDANAGEMFLWHGTKPEVADLIARDGFEERLAAPRCLFGAGNYFAECSSKSDQYCTPDHNGTYYMLLCRVAMGTPIVVSDARSGMRLPPLRVEAAPALGRYDSLLGRVREVKYREFVVYDGAQCYPEFVVEYGRRPPPPAGPPAGWL